VAFTGLMKPYEPRSAAGVETEKYAGSAPHIDVGRLPGASRAREATAIQSSALAAIEPALDQVPMACPGGAAVQLVG
jgi:hypothetical protein